MFTFCSREAEWKVQSFFQKTQEIQSFMLYNSYKEIIRGNFQIMENKHESRVRKLNFKSEIF